MEPFLWILRNPPVAVANSKNAASTSTSASDPTPSTVPAMRNGTSDTDPQEVLTPENTSSTTSTATASTRGFQRSPKRTASFVYTTTSTKSSEYSITSPGIPVPMPECSSTNTSVTNDLEFSFSNSSTPSSVTASFQYAKRHERESEDYLDLQSILNLQEQEQKLKKQQLFLLLQMQQQQHQEEREKDGTGSQTPEQQQQRQEQLLSSSSFPAIPITPGIIPLTHATPISTTGNTTTTTITTSDITLSKVMPNPFTKSERVKLNVGGKIFETTKQTFSAYPNSLLGTMFQPRNRDIIPTDTDHYFFDRNPKIFEKVLEFYRTGTVDWNPDKMSLSALTAEFDYFQIPEASELLREKEKTAFGEKLSSVSMERVRDSIPAPDLPFYSILISQTKKALEHAARNGRPWVMIKYSNQGKTHFGADQAGYDSYNTRVMWIFANPAYRLLFLHDLRELGIRCFDQLGMLLNDCLVHVKLKNAWPSK